MTMQVFALTLSTLFGIGFLLPIIWRSHSAKAATISLWAALLASVIGVSGAVWYDHFTPSFWTLSTGLEQVINLSATQALTLEFRLDSLSAFFVLLVSVFSAIVAIYSFDALKAPHYLQFRSRIASAFNLFVWATLAVLMAYDILSLIIVLEIMTLAFGYLVLYKHTLYQDETPNHPIGDEKQNNARLAPQVYLMISHTSTAFLLIAFLLLATQAGSISFIDLIKNKANIDGTVTTIIFLLGLIGLGIRAGLIPAHIWVSLVHPSSPTTTHALSLGIAIKVAVYLMYRFFFQFLEPVPWWGYLVLLIAVTTALVNVWYAIYSHDLKTALAYHSIENIGIICAGIGVAMIFWKDQPILASLALVASLYHLLNHAVFKGLLYLATGAIDHLTHQTVELDKLGGLIHRYAFTATMFLVGSFAIAGFPPLNGFISEWLTLQALFKGLGAGREPFSIVVIFLSLLMLVASFALTAFCFYKMTGLTLLGQPRLSQEERKEWEPKDVPFRMRFVMGLMALLCLLLGIFPGPVAYQLSQTLQPLGIATPVVAEPLSFVSFSLVKAESQLDTDKQIEMETKPELPKDSLPPIVPGLLGAILGLTLIPAVVHFGWLRLRKVQRPKQAWNCGTPFSDPPVSQYTSSAVSFLLRNTFPFVGLKRRLGTLRDDLPAHLALSKSEQNPQEVIEFFRAAYNLIIAQSVDFSERFGGEVQNGDIRRSLAYVFITTVVALVIFIWLAK